MPYVDVSTLNYPITATTALRIRREDRAPIDNQDGLSERLLTFWHDKDSDDVYMLVARSKAQGISTWVLIGGTSGAVQEFLVSSGTSPVVPNGSNQITLTDGNGVGITGGTNAWTTDMVSPFTGDFVFTGIVTTNDHFNVDPGSDITTSLITVEVTDTPTFSWDEDADGFRFTKGCVIGVQGVLKHIINGATVDAELEIHSENTQNLGGITIHRHTDTAAFGSHVVNLRSNGTHASPTIVADDDIVSRYLSCGYDGVYYSQMAEIRSEVDGTPGLNDMPGRWIFSTTPSGTQILAEVARFDSSQNTTLSGNFTATKAASGTTLSALVSNTSNTASSSSQIEARVAGTSAGNPSIRWNVSGATTFDRYIDNGDSDTLKLRLSGVGVYESLTTGGVFSYPFQPAFSSQSTATVTNATGDNTNYQIDTLTNLFNIGGNFNASTGVFTVQEAGIYWFNLDIRLENIGAAHNVGNMSMTASTAGGSGDLEATNPSTTRQGNNTLGWNGSHLYQLTAGETVVFNVQVGGSTKTVSVNAKIKGFKLA